MIIKRTYTVTLLAIGMALGIAQTGCKDPKEGVDLVLDAGITEATMGVRFINARTGEPVGAGEDASMQVTVSLHGEDASDIVASDGSLDYVCSEGFLALAVKTGVTPSETAPVRFRLVCSAPGYLKTSQVVTLTGLGGIDVTIPMVEIANVPDGVAAASGSVSAVSGTGTSSAFTLNSGNPVTTMGVSSATVTIPQGTVMMDDNGQTLTGQIDVDLAYFNPLDENSVQSFPGGFGASTVAEGDIVFSTGGFVSLEMTKESNNRAVKSFGSPITLTVEMPTGLTDNNGVTVTDGTVCPIWSYDTGTGEWTFETNAIASTNPGTGRIEVNFPVTHLSYWNIDWFNNSCLLGATINVNSNIGCNGYRWVQVRNGNNNQLIYQGYRDMKSGSFRLVNVPNAPIKIKVFEVQGGTELIGSVDIANACSGSHTLNVNSSASGQEISVVVNLRCPDSPNFIFRPTLPLWAKPTGGTWQYIGQMVNGNFSTCALTVGSTYYFATFYDGEFLVAPEPYTLTQTNYVFEQTMNAATCNQF
jgi:hypothetical protein